MKKLLFIISLIIIVTLAFAIKYPGKGRYFAKATAHFDENYNLSHYSIYTYDKNKRVIREDLVKIDGKKFAYVTNTYDNNSNLVSEKTYDIKNNLTSEKVYQYNELGQKKHSVISFADKKKLFVWYTYGYNDGRIIYDEELWYNNSIQDDKYLLHVKQTTYDLKEQAARISYYQNSGFNHRSQNKSLKLKWYDDVKYNHLGRVDSIVRYDSNNYSRTYIKYLYDSFYRLRKVLIYEGSSQFNHPESVFRKDFKLIQKINLLYKLRKDLVKPEKKPERVEEIIKREKSNEMEVIFIDEPEDVELPQPISDLPPDVTTKPVDKQPVDKQPVIKPVDKPKRKSTIKSWALKINKKFTIDPYYSLDGTIILGIEGNKVLNIDPDGKLLWSLDTIGNTIVGPKEFDVNVYIATDKEMVYAINMENGKIIWQKEKMGKFAPKANFVLTNSKVIFSNGNKKLIALNRLDGKVMWEFEADDIILFSPVTRDDKNVYIATKNKIYSINIENGGNNWDEEYDDNILIQPILAENLIVRCSENGIYAFDSSNGSSKKWVIDKINAKTRAFFYEGFFYLGTDEGKIIKVNIKTGSVQWSKKLNLVDFHIKANESYIIISYGSDDIILLDQRTGDELSRYEGARNDLIITPILLGDDNNTIYYGSNSWKLYKDTID